MWQFFFKRKVWRAVVQLFTRSKGAASHIQVTSSAQIFSATFTRGAGSCIWYLVSRRFDSWQHNVITQMFFLDEVVIFLQRSHCDWGDSYRMWGGRWRKVGELCLFLFFVRILLTVPGRGFYFDYWEVSAKNFTLGSIALGLADSLYRLVCCSSASFNSAWSVLTYMSSMF